MNRRSIQSFQRQTQEPANPKAARDATAYRSPVLISASQRRCGVNGRNLRSATERRKLSASGRPILTAKTPAFSSGRPSMLATSPAAKTSGSLTD